MTSAFIFANWGVSNIGRPKKNTETYSNTPSDNTININAGTLNPKQSLFWNSKTLYTCYGGARGGGKTHVMRLKAIHGCLQYPGIKILIVRRKYKDLLENHIEPIKKLVPPQVAEYNNTTHVMYFVNGSTIKFGHYNYDSSADDYQGQEYDWIFIDEATQFTEQQFRMLGGCLRGVNKIPKHFYLSCNPGGIGHRWVKRLFIDKEYKTNCKNPEENENPKDYKFIFASVEDNTDLMKSSPGYIQMLSSMPERLRAAHRYGDWNALSGAYFDEFSEALHVIEPFKIPDDWRRYRAFDYGLDMLACYWIAVDFYGRCYVYREICEPGLIVKDAAQEIRDNTMPGEHIDITFAPPDMWTTLKDSGKTMAETFMLNGVPVVKVSNNRVQGHMQIKEMLAPSPTYDGKGKLKPKDEWQPQLLIFNNCKHIIEDLAAIQADEKKPNDCAKDPHDITHSVDGLRYFCVSRTMPAVQERELSRTARFDDEDDAEEDYENFMTGGEPTAEYIAG